MAEIANERRKFERRRIRLTCHLQLNTGLLVHGHTQNMSREGVFMETQSLPAHQQQRGPQPGDVGIISLRYTNDGVAETLKASCRVMHVMAHGVGLNLFYSRLSLSEQRIITRILETGTGYL